MSLDLWGIVIAVVSVHFLALISPGPDFVLIVKSTIKNGRKPSIFVAGGIAFANAIYIFLCLIGVGEILASSVTLLSIMKILGGLFLIYLAIQAFRTKKSDYEILTFKKTQQKKHKSQ